MWNKCFPLSLKCWKEMAQSIQYLLCKYGGPELDLQYPYEILDITGQLCNLSIGMWGQRLPGALDNHSSQIESLYVHREYIHKRKIVERD